MSNKPRKKAKPVAPPSGGEPDPPSDHVGHPVPLPVRERLRAYIAEVRAAEEERLGDRHVIGVSFWLAAAGRLDEIKRRHGFTPDHSLVRSVAAYLDERQALESDWIALRRALSPPTTVAALLQADRPLTPEEERVNEEYLLFQRRLDHCSARHFPRFDGSVASARTPADVWAWIVRFVTLPLPPSYTSCGPSSLPTRLTELYGRMHDLGLAGVPTPPYPRLDETEVRHEFARIAGLLVSSDRTAYDRAYAEEASYDPLPPNFVPTLADLLDYYRLAEPGRPPSLADGFPWHGSGPESGRAESISRPAVMRLLEGSRERHQFADLASERGFCEVGDCDARAVEAIKSSLVARKGLSPANADGFPVAEVVRFLGELPAGASGDDSGRWLKVSDAAQVSGIAKSAISRAMTDGKLKGNGLKGAMRRIDAIDLIRYQLERMREDERAETDAVVKRKFDRQGGR